MSDLSFCSDSTSTSSVNTSSGASDVGSECRDTSAEAQMSQQPGNWTQASQSDRLTQVCSACGSTESGASYGQSHVEGASFTHSDYGYSFDTRAGNGSENSLSSGSNETNSGMEASVTEHVPPDLTNEIGTEPLNSPDTSQPALEEQSAQTPEATQQTSEVEIPDTHNQSADDLENQQNLGEFKESLQAIENKAKELSENLQNAYKEGIEAISEGTVGGVIEGVGTIVSQSVQSLTEGVQLAGEIEGIGELIEGSFGEINDFAEMGGGIIGEALEGKAEIIAEIAEAAVEVAREYTQVQTIADYAGAVSELSKGINSISEGNFADGMEHIGNAALTAGHGMLPTEIKAGYEVAEGVVEVVGEVVEGVVEVGWEIGEGIHDIAENAFK